MPALSLAVTYPRTNGAPRARRCATPRRAQRRAAGSRPKTGAIRSSFCTSPMKAGFRELIPIRFGRMSQSPFAFYRGSAAVMAADLASTPASGLRVQACGDAHLMNFGGFATPERNIFFDINDFDETLPAPWEWDVKRLAASIVIAAHHIGCPTARRPRRRRKPCAPTESKWPTTPRCTRWTSGTTASISTAFSRSCRPAQEVERVRQRVEQARRKSLPESLFPKLVEHYGSAPRIKDEPPLIFHPTEEQAPGVASGYADALERYRKSLPEHVRTLFDRFHLFDFAIKVVGVGSVGTFCALGLFMAADDDPIFLQVKEARKSVLEPYAGKCLHTNQGERVVAGQRLMQSASDIFLGWTRGVERPRLLFPPASRREDFCGPGRLGRDDAAGIWQALRLGAGSGARAVWRCGDDRGLHGLQHDLRRCDLRVRGRIRRPEPSRLPRLRQGGPGGSNKGCVGGLRSALR